MNKKLKNRLIITVVVLIFILTNFNVVLATNNNFLDVVNYYPYNSWAIEVGQKYNLIFLENNTRACKRYEIASVMYYLLNLKQTSCMTKFNDLNDIDDKTKEKINSIAEYKIILGYEDNTFRPNNNVTRAEFVTMLERSGIFKKTKEKTNITFSDIENHWAKKNIEYISSLGIISGRGNNLFYPDDEITPQEILIIIDRMVDSNCIASQNLISAMIGTFKCKQYSDKEKYIIEVMFSEFDEVQNFMNYAFPYKKYYDYTKWNELATYEDIQYATYFMMSYYTELLDNGETRQMFNDIGNTILEEKSSPSKEFTMRDFLHAVSKLERVARVGMRGRGATNKTQMPTINYTNTEDITDKDKEMFRRIVGNEENIMLVNNSMYFPFEAPITKYMLNYFIVKLEKTYNSYAKSLSYGILEFLGHGIEYTIEKTQLPTNYNEYPYIVKDVPKELYEQSYIYSNNFTVNTPIQIYSVYSEAMRTIGSHAFNYYQTLLNVDYRTITEETFANDVSSSLYYVPREDITKYVQYVKNNEIILEGKGAVVPGTMYLVDGTLYMKAILEFKVLSAKSMKNLLFGDLREDLPQDIEYTQNEYTLYHNVPIYRQAYLNYDGKFMSKFKMSYEPICEGVDWLNRDYKLP